MFNIDGDLKFPTSQKDTVSVYLTSEDKVHKKITQIPMVDVSADDRATLEAQIKEKLASINELKKAYDALIVPDLPEAPKPDHNDIAQIQIGDNLSKIAERYHCTVADIKNANPDLGDLIAGFYINVPAVSEEKWKPYAALVEEKNRISKEKYKLDMQIHKLENEVRIAKNIIRSQEIIGEIQAGKRFEHFDKRYSFSINSKTGNLCIKMKEELAMSKIKRDFRLADGVIRKTNVDSNGETILKDESFGERFFYTNYDDKIAPVGQILQLPPFECAPRTR